VSSEDARIMKQITVLVTGARGFIGKHLMEALAREQGVEAIGYDLGDSATALEQGLATVDVVFHLAGVNRPTDPEEFKTGNADFTESLCSRLTAMRRRPLFIMSSSIQATLDNPYGTSKRLAEEAVGAWAKGEGKGAKRQGPEAKGENQGAKSQGPRAIIFRLKNVFGKWCRPNYNSVTATFCHNIAHDLPITITDPTRELDLVYIDDVIRALLAALEERRAGRESGGEKEGHAESVEARASGDRGNAGAVVAAPATTAREPRALPTTTASSEFDASPVEFREVTPVYRITLGDLAARIRSFRESRTTLVLPDFSDPFNRCLYATYLSYLDGPDFAYALEQRTDPRGSLAEFVKSAAGGQIFVSRTKPGVTRGNHYHHTKTEKFLVVEGEAIIRFRPLSGQGQRAKDEGEGVKGQDGGSELTAPGASPLALGLIEHRVNGREFKVVDIPPGYSHSIENVGETELVTIFWASEVFDPARPDTYPLSVMGEAPTTPAGVAGGAPALAPGAGALPGTSASLQQKL